jgi:ABC-type dipeptide/oligopeptide/nickel transport system permease component
LILVFAVNLRLLPVQGIGTWQHFVMPTVTLGIGQVALIARLTRSSMIEVLTAHYIQTARAKGLKERRVITRHALRNVLIPIITVVGLSIGGLLGGAVITESIFGLPGVGRLAIEAIHNRDYPMIQGTVLLVASSFVFVNLIVDVIYAYIDPRIRYE